MTDLPVDFIARTKPLLKTDWDKFVTALTTDAPTSIRLNKVKSNDYKPDAESVLWCDAGYYLDKRPQFTFDPLFHAGRYYVQEASSMFIGQALSQYISGDVKVLDLCAAPGGKSTLIADIISENSLLISNEVIRSRAHILAENITKWGKPNTIVTNNDPAQMGKLNNFFDIILVDAPCSGEGMFRKDEGAIAEWSVDNVKLCKERQQRILADIWPALKPGGLLLYSTCTYNLEENEQNVQWIRDELQAEVLPVATKDEWNISPSFADDIHAYRFFPHKTKGEGFFFALLRKTGTEQEDSTNFKKVKNNKEQKMKVKLDAHYQDYIRDKDNYTFYPKGEAWHAFPSALYNDLLLVQSQLSIVSMGICLGEFKGRDFIPSQSLAMSDNLNIKAFNPTVIDWNTAISYLRKEALTLVDQPKGYILLIYNNIPLGFVKNIGNRANNLYPQEWRIRSANIPDKAVEVLQ